jgi:hypothetical protein
MNIFFLDWDPKKCAEYICNIHLNKMLIEGVQILYSVYHLLNPELLLISDLIPYKLTHKNHPCVKWSRESF